MRNDDADATDIETNGWRQGSTLPPSLVRRLIDEYQIPSVTLPRDDVCRGSLSGLRQAWKQHRRRRLLAQGIVADHELWMVVTQDCDLVQPSFEKEPEVELLRLRVVSTDDKNGNFHWGANPRTFQFFDPPDGANRRLLETEIHNRVAIDRRYLRDVRPDFDRGLDVENVKRVCRWISQRYVRAAFPDEFNRRIKSICDKLASSKGLLAKKGELLTGIYMQVEDVELPKESDYRVVIWATMKSLDYGDQSKRVQAQQMVDEIDELLSKCDGIDIEEFDLKSEQDFTLDHIRKFKRWDFDSLSMRKESVSELPPQT